MNKIQKLIIGEMKTTERKNFIWNMLGSAIFATVSMLLSFFVIRVLGAEKGGIFSIAITISQMMAFIAYYETRTYQVTDVKNMFRFGEYKATKLLLCVIMMIVCVIYMWMRERSFNEKTWVVLLMCAYRMIDGYADLYEGTFQNDGRLDLAGKSQTFRTILSAGVFIVSMLVTKQLIFSLILAIVAAVLGLYLFDIAIMKYFRKIHTEASRKGVLGILKSCFPLFVGSFLWTYILSAGRIAIDSNLPNNYQSYYQILFMPISVINLCATFIMKPMLPKLAETYSKKEYGDFRKQIRNIALVIIGFTVICMLGAYLLGIPVLSWLSNCELKPYRKLLVFLMLAGGVNSLAYMMYYVLTVMRCTKGIFVGYTSTACLVAVISDLFVKRIGIEGAALGFFVSVFYLLVIFGIFFEIILRKNGKPLERKD